MTSSAILVAISGFRQACSGISPLAVFCSSVELLPDVTCMRSELRCGAIEEATLLDETEAV